MDNFEEIRKRGVFTIYLDTDYKDVRAVETYNEDMRVAQAEKKQMEYIPMSVMICNPVFLLCLGVIGSGRSTMMNHPVLFIAVMAVFTLIFLFTIFTKRFFILTAASGMLMLISVDFWILVALNIVLAFLYKRKSDALKTRMGYPAFAEIKITSSDRNKSDLENLTRRFDDE